MGRKGRVGRSRAIPAAEARAQPMPHQALSENSIQSSIVKADWTGIWGWVWDSRDPKRRLEVELLDGETSLLTVPANRYRKELVDAGVGDGWHGFMISLGDALLPFARHILHLRPVGSLYEVKSFPLVLTRNQRGFDLTVVRFLLQNVEAELRRAKRPDDLLYTIKNLVQLLDPAMAKYHALVKKNEPGGTKMMEAT